MASSIDLKVRFILPSILVYLPVKSLLQLRSVSKEWLALIDSQDFIDTHFYYSCSHRMISLYCQPFEESPDGFHEANFHVVGSCVGILCLVRMERLLRPERTVFQVSWLNPLTRRLKRLPDFEYDPQRLPTTVSYGFGLGAGYLKVAMLVIVQTRSGDASEYDSTCFVYSRSTNIWRRILKNKRFRFGIHSYRETNGFRINSGSPFVNGALHWLVRERDKDWSVVTFDLTTEKYGKIRRPEFSATTEGPFEYEVHALEGNLCVTRCAVSKEGLITSTQLSILKDYDDHNSWCEEVTFQGLARFCPRPLVYSQDRNKILFSWDNACIWYNLRNREPEFCDRVWRPNGMFEAYPFIDSLVTFDGEVSSWQIQGSIIQNLLDSSECSIVD